MVLGEPFEPFVIHTQQRLTLRTPEVDRLPGGGPFYGAKTSESLEPDPPV